jgi:hypothetical protein
MSDIDDLIFQDWLDKYPRTQDDINFYILKHCCYDEDGELVHVLEDVYEISLRIYGLREIPDLTYFKDYVVDLDLSYNQLTSINTNFLKLKKLEYVSFCGNRYLEKIENLYELDNLLYLNFHDTGISKIENIETLIKLKHLDITDTNINIIENIDYNDQLVDLTISRNAIKYSYYPVDKMENYIKKNYLGDIKYFPFNEDEFSQRLTEFISLIVKTDEIVYNFKKYIKNFESARPEFFKKMLLNSKDIIFNSKDIGENNISLIY